MTCHAANEAARGDGTPRGKIVLDLSDNPVREMLLVAVLSEMVKAATAENAVASEANDQEPTVHAPVRGLKRVENVSLP